MAPPRTPQSQGRDLSSTAGGDALFVSRRSSGVDVGRILLAVIGTALVLMGAALLLALGLVALEVMTKPSEVQILALFLDAPKPEGGALFGHIANTPFSIGIDEPLRTLLFLVLALWLLGAVASILKTLVMTGKELLMASRRSPPDQ